MNTKELIEQWPDFDDATRSQLLGAIATRGKHKGYILANAPAAGKRPQDWLAWQVLISNLAPARVSVWGLMWKSEDYTELDKRLTKNFVFALNAIEPSMRWSLWATRYDRELVIESLPELIQQMNFRKHQRELF